MVIENYSFPHFSFVCLHFKKLSCGRAGVEGVCAEVTHNRKKKYNNEAPLNVNEPFEAVNGTDEK